MTYYQIFEYNSDVTEVEIEHEIEHSSGGLALLTVLGVSPDGYEDPVPVEIDVNFRGGSWKEDDIELVGVEECREFLEEEWDYDEVVEMLKNKL